MLIKRYLSVLLFAPLLLCVVLVTINLMTSNPVSYVNASRIIYPYALFCLSVFLWSQHKTPGAIRRIIYRLPLVFVLIETVYLSAENYLGLPESLGFIGLTAVVIMLAVFVVILGYVYIFLAEIGYIALLQLHRFDQYKSTGRKMSLHC